MAKKKLALFFKRLFISIRAIGMLPPCILLTAPPVTAPNKECPTTLPRTLPAQPSSQSIL